jgi:hypothetical protein
VKMDFYCRDWLVYVRDARASNPMSGPGSNLLAALELCKTFGDREFEYLSLLAGAEVPPTTVAHWIEKVGK